VNGKDQLVALVDRGLDERRRRSIFGDAVTYAETLDELAAGLLCAAASHDGSAVAREESVAVRASRLARCFIMRGLRANSLETAALGPEGFHDVGTGPGSPEAKFHRLAHDQ
jgi:hypothetical protein